MPRVDVRIDRLPGESSILGVGLAPRMRIGEEKFAVLGPVRQWDQLHLLVVHRHFLRQVQMQAPIAKARMPSRQLPQPFLNVAVFSGFDIGNSIVAQP